MIIGWEEKMADEEKNDAGGGHSHQTTCVCIGDVPLSLPARAVDIAGRLAAVNVETETTSGVCLFDCVPPERLLEGQLLLAHKRPVTSLAFSPNKDHSASPCTLVTCSADSLVFWDISRARRDLAAGRAAVGRTLPWYGESVQSVTWDMEGLRLAVCCQLVVLVLDADTCEVLARLSGHQAPIREALFLQQRPDQILTVSEDRSFKVWNLDSKNVLHSSAILGPAPLSCVAVDSRSHKCYIGDDTGKLRIFTLAHASCPLLWTVDLADVWSPSESTDCAEDDRSTPRLAGRACVPLSGSATGDELPCSAEISTAVLSIFVPVRDEEKCAEVADGNLGTASPVVVATSKGIVVLDTMSLDVVRVLPFTAAEPSPFHRVGFCGVASFTVRRPSNVVFGLVTSAFVPQMTLVQLVDEEVTGPMPAPGLLRRQGPVDMNLHPHTPLSRWKFLPSGASFGGRGRGRSSGRRSVGVPSARPVVFRRVKSSGYGPSTKPDWQRWKGKRKSSRDQRTERKSRQGPGSYPLTCGVMDVMQRKHWFPDLRLHAGPITRVCYGPSAKAILTCSTDGTAATHRLPFSKHKGAGFQFVGDNSVCSLLTELGVMQVENGPVLCAGHESPVRTCSWSHKRTRAGMRTGSITRAQARGVKLEAHSVVTAGSDKTARIWKEGRADPVMVLRCERSSKKPSDSNPLFSDEISAASFFNQDRFVLLTCGKTLRMFRYSFESDASVDAQRATARYQSTFVFCPPDARVISTFKCVNSFMSDVAFISDSRRDITVVDFLSGKASRRIENAHRRQIHTLAINEYSTGSELRPWLLSASTDGGGVKLWDLRARRCARRFCAHINQTMSVGAAFSPCLRYIASGSEDASAYLYDIGSGKYLSKLAGHGDVVTDVAFHPYVPQLVTACADGRVRFFSDANI